MVGGRSSRVPWRLGAAALCVILIVAGLLLRRPIAAWVAGVPGEKHLAVLPFHNIGGDPSSQLFCDGVVKTVTSKLAQLERFQKSFWVVPSSEVRKVKDLADAERSLGVTLVVSGSMQRMGSVVRLIANLNDAHGRKLLASRTIDARMEDLPALEDRVWQQVADMLDLQIAPETKKVLSEGETQIPGAYEYYQQGRGYSVRFGVESIDRAIGLYKQAIERDPQYALAYSGIAEAYAKKFDLTKDVNMIDAARQNSDRALAINDKLSPVLLTAARVAFVSGNREQAIQFWKRTLDMDPASAEAMMWLGRAYDDLGRLTEAESAYNNAVALRPGYWAGYSAMGYFYKVHGQYSRAENTVQRAAGLSFTENPANYENLGGVLS